jgi:hypothetical protein
MLTLRRFFICISLALLATTACRKTSTTGSSTVATPDTLIPGTFITTGGKFTHSDGMTTHSLEVTQSGTSLSLGFSSQRRLPSGDNTRSSSGTGMSSISSPTDPWFVYVESPERFWFFDGKSGLHNFYPDGGSSGPAISSGKIQRGSATVPADVILRLPDDLRKLLPPVEPPVKRPSL